MTQLQENQEEVQSKISIQTDMSVYYIDKWYDSIESFTFNTELVPLDIETAQSIVRYHYHRYGNQTQTDDDQSETAIAYNILKTQTHEGKDLKFKIPNDIDTINEFSQNMNKHVTRCQQLWNNNKLFVRLSNRSAKDGDKIYGANGANKYEDNLRELMAKCDDDEKYDDDDVLNYQMIACMQCIYDDLWIDNANDLVSLLLSSQRIYFDLMNHLIVYYAENANEWNVYIAIREFDDRLRDELEFRCFVYGSELTAISQYNTYCFYDGLAQNKDDIECAIINYWLQVSKHIDYDDYVIDIALIESDEYECVVVEINPFSELTSGCLFDWSIDKHVLKGSDIGQIVFRIYDDKHKFNKYSIAKQQTVQTLLNKYTSKLNPCVNVSWMEYLTLQQQQSKKRDCIVL
eukprot:204685_1